MNDYEGLNLPELLALLHDIVEPPAASWLPVTGGWWVLACWLLTALALCGLALRRRYQQNRYRRVALARVEEILAESAQPAAELVTLLKRTALAAYPRGQVAGLYGAAWRDFLIDASGDDPLVRETAAQIAAAAYDPSLSEAAAAPELAAGVRRWIRCHRA
ncbi:MAG: DUF4381 domain-containing protein [Pseudomonadota bacterium]